MSQDTSVEAILHSLRERAKELNCLYKVDELLRQRERPWHEVLRMVSDALPAGWQFSEICRSTVTLNGQEYSGERFERSEWSQHADIVLDGAKTHQCDRRSNRTIPPTDRGPGRT
jgi:hypothetical protein